MTTLSTKSAFQSNEWRNPLLDEGDRDAGGALASSLQQDPAGYSTYHPRIGLSS